MTTNPIKKYSAPALEKGLDILELLSKDSSAHSTSAIADMLGRSNAEIYRMLLVLEQRGYIEKSKDVDGYQVTQKLLQLGTEHEPVKDILEYALPVMRELAEKTTMSCHIAVESQEQIVVISRVEASSAMSYSVKVGFRAPYLFSPSGKVFFTFQNSDKKVLVLDRLSKIHKDDDIKSFIHDCKKVGKQGYYKGDNACVKGVTDLSFPIIDNGYAVASLTIPYIERIPEDMSIDETVHELKLAAEELSKALTYGIVRKM